MKNYFCIYIYNHFWAKHFLIIKCFIFCFLSKYITLILLLNVSYKLYCFKIVYDIVNLMG